MLARVVPAALGRTVFAGIGIGVFLTHTREIESGRVDLVGAILLSRERQSLARYAEASPTVDSGIRRHDGAHSTPILWLAAATRRPRCAEKTGFGRLGSGCFCDLSRSSATRHAANSYIMILGSNILRRIREVPMREMSLLPQLMILFGVVSVLVAGH